MRALQWPDDPITRWPDFLSPQTKGNNILDKSGSLGYLLTMPLNDSQLVGLLQLILAQQKEITNLKAHVIAIEALASELAGSGVERRLLQDIQELQQSKNFDSSRELVALLEKAIVQLLPTSGVN